MKDQIETEIASVLESVVAADKQSAWSGVGPQELLVSPIPEKF